MRLIDQDGRAHLLTHKNGDRAIRVVRSAIIKDEVVTILSGDGALISMRGHALAGVYAVMCELLASKPGLAGPLTEES